MVGSAPELMIGSFGNSPSPDASLAWGKAKSDAFAQGRRLPSATLRAFAFLGALGFGCGDSSAAGLPNRPTCFTMALCLHAIPLALKQLQKHIGCEKRELVTDSGRQTTADT